MGPMLVPRKAGVRQVLRLIGKSSKIRGKSHCICGAFLSNVVFMAGDGSDTK